MLGRLRGSNIPKLELAIGTVLGVFSGVYIFDSALQKAAADQQNPLNPPREGAKTPSAAESTKQQTPPTPPK